MKSNRQIIVIPQKTNKSTTRKKKVRVAAYARVSTEKDDQLNSLELQKNHYFKYIKAKSEWEFVGIYYDEGITGLNTKKRDGFNKMITDALEGRIDLIITKSISRFARNVVDTLEITRKLRFNDIGVFFEKENLNSLDATSDFVLSVLASAAEEESKTISSNVKWGMRQNFKEGRFTLPYSNFFGYKKGANKYEMVIDKGQAPIVRMIYRLFLEKNSLLSIAKRLNQLNIPSPCNSKWGKNVILSILKNEKYMGDALLQKTFIKDIYNHKRKINEGELKQYYIVNSHDAIVSKDVYNEVQLRLKDRGLAFSSIDTYSSLLKCSLCGNIYHIRYYINHHYKTPIKQWICSNKHNKEKRCKNIVLYDDALDCMMKELYINLFNQYPSILKQLNSEITKTCGKKHKLTKLLLSSNKIIHNGTFRTITKSVVVGSDDTLKITLIDDSTHVLLVPKWSIVNKCFKDKTLKDRFVEEYKPGVCGYKKLAKKYNVSIGTIRYWLNKSH